MDPFSSMLRDLFEGSLLQQASSAVEDVLQQGIEHATSTASTLWDSVRGTTLAKKTTEQLERSRAHWMWSAGPGLGYTQRVPLPVDSQDRLLIASAGLAKVVMDQVREEGWETLTSRRPVTLVLLALNVAAFATPGGLPLRDVCLSPYCVVEKRQWIRLLTPCVVHLDATHLVSNLRAVVPDCLALEASSGSALCAAELLLLTITSHSLYVGWAWWQKRALGWAFEYYSVGALGLSSLAFALEVVVGERRNSQTLLLGLVPLQSRFSWVATLALEHLLLPDASFPCHMCGAAAGLLYVYCVQPLLSLVGIRPAGQSAPRLHDMLRVAMSADGDRGPFWGAGTTGGRVLGPGGVELAAGEAASVQCSAEHGMGGGRLRSDLAMSGRGRASTQSDTARQRHLQMQATFRWRRARLWALQLGTQLGLLGLATAVYAVSRRRAGGKAPGSGRLRLAALWPGQPAVSALPAHHPDVAAWRGIAAGCMSRLQRRSRRDTGWETTCSTPCRKVMLP